MSPPEPPPAPPARAPEPGVPGPRGSRYGWFVGVVALLVIALITVNTISTTPNGSRGVATGQPLPPFAVPLALGTLNGDADMRPPCSLAQHDPRALNVCLIARHTPLVLAFFVPEELSHGETSKPHAQTRAGWLSHLAVN